ncbi:hypothetical protein KCP71_12105 [Salmonella enterica subsp. enterica]|nr:hypothetical protein KCP71_12105 [Salmonella enterica subsp. enterica]
MAVIENKCSAIIVFRLLSWLLLSIWRWLLSTWLQLLYAYVIHAMATAHQY